MTQHFVFQKSLLLGMLVKICDQTFITSKFNLSKLLNERKVINLFAARGKSFLTLYSKN